MIDFKHIYDYCSNQNLIEEKRQISEEIANFMTGMISERLRAVIEKEIDETVRNENIDLVCFAPGSTGAKTILRFGELADRLSSILPCDVYLDAVTLADNADPDKQERVYQCKRDRVSGKKVLVVGSVYSTGTAMNTIGSLLLKNKAKSVFGLFVAKEIKHTK